MESIASDAFESSPAVVKSTSSPKGEGKGKGKGKGYATGPPPPPKGGGPKRSSVDQSAVKVKVREGGDSLRQTPVTVVTHLDGRRVAHHADGRVEELERAGGSRRTEKPKAKIPLDEIKEALKPLLAREPRLEAYAQQLYIGVPLPALKARISGELGAELAQAFAISAGEKNEEEEDVPSELQGEMSAKHGRLGVDAWAAPQLAVRCGALARPGYQSGLAHEYLDSEDVIKEKVRVMAGLIRQAKRLVIYAGAGLSTASGIHDYATRAGATSIASQPATKVNPPSPTSARPTLAHRVIAALGQQGLVWRFVQQNHDGLPQKAGFPQRLMNEIHGGWFDPSNPVVKMSGNLRSDLYSDLLKCERKADLVLVVGTSLSGMNSDRLVSTCASRAKRSVPSDPVFGSIIVALQRTSHDSDSSLRLFATTDDVFALLAEELALTVRDMSENISFPVPPEHLPFGPQTPVFSVPYDESGMPLAAEEGQQRRWLDLRDNSSLVVTVGKDKGRRLVVLGTNEDGHYRLGLIFGDLGKWCDVRLLGSWWPAAAVAGELHQLPIVSVGDDGKSQQAADA
eukprot:TRINITY_DN48195_c0_g1_i1.p1 TRINITY_DN48195_c0_g1~~TRINITY_DN48195_c0_g1_i1.p1  ORF type:complete len:586 (-),score=92.10 TRINITY_DN48195_c0_g1_i1:104-1810(-)